MTHFKKTLIAGIALFAMSVSASQAKADTWRHLQKLALDIQLKSDALMGETHHYVHAANYQRMIRSISSMRARAVRVHVLSLQHGCLIAMAEELRVLDAQFHAIEALFDSAECKASHGHGHIHGATAHVKAHLKCIEDDIHHIRDDIAELTRPVYRQPYSSGYRSGYGSSYSSGYGSSYRGSYTNSYRGHGSHRSSHGVYKVHPRSQYYQTRGHGHGHGHSKKHGHASSRIRYNPGAGISYSDGNFSIRIGR